MIIKNTRSIFISYVLIRSEVLSFWCSIKIAHVTKIIVCKCNIHINLSVYFISKFRTTIITIIANIVSIIILCTFLFIIEAEVITEEEKEKIKRKLISSRTILDNYIVITLKTKFLGYQKREKERVYF